MIYTHVMQDGVCGIKSPLARVRMIQQRENKTDSPAPEEPVREESTDPAPGGDPARETQKPKAENVGLITCEPEPYGPVLRTALAVLQRFGFAAAACAALLLGRRQG